VPWKQLSHRLWAHEEWDVTFRDYAWIVIRANGRTDARTFPTALDAMAIIEAEDGIKAPSAESVSRAAAAAPTRSPLSPRSSQRYNK
jgi:hypothetical protein